MPLKNIVRDVGVTLTLTLVVYTASSLTKINQKFVKTENNIEWLKTVTEETKSQLNALTTKVDNLSIDIARNGEKVDYLQKSLDKQHKLTIKQLSPSPYYTQNENK
jgi:septal ring factor EnvC (AmiA/AmiB activator)